MTRTTDTTLKAGALAALAAGLAAALAAALLALAMLAEPAQAATKTVTKTFSSTQPIMIPSSGSAAPYPSEKNTGGFKKGKILDVNLTLKNFSHTFPADVDVMLSHRGAVRTVMSDVGAGITVNNITLTLDDEAANSLSGTTQLTAGAFKPTNLGAVVDSFPAPAPTPSGTAKLSGFDGKNPNGLWSLWVVDDNGGDVGQIAGGWSIKIKARVAA